MNRREFTRGLASLGIAPALPLPALGAAPSAGVASAAVSAAAEKMYFWGWFSARVHDRCSPEMLQNMLKVSPEVAAEVNNRLIRNGAITAPNALGVSKAVDPLYDMYNTLRVKAVGSGTGLKRPPPQPRPAPARPVPEAMGSAGEKPRHSPVTASDGSLNDGSERSVDKSVDKRGDKPVQNLDEPGPDGQNLPRVNQDAPRLGHAHESDRIATADQARPDPDIPQRGD